MNDQKDHAFQRTISFSALQRARATLEDFTRSYFPYLGLQFPTDFFKYLDVLVWVEASIYQLDEDNERLTQQGRLDPDHAAEGIAGIRQVLWQQGLASEALDQELGQGLCYWRLEQSICARLRAAPRPLQAPATLTSDEVLECHVAKSFDYRVMCLLLFGLTRKQTDPQLLEFLRLDEQLVDINDDLVDYEDDVLANSFNIFRCFIHIYGRDAELKLVERISSLEEQHSRLLATLAPELQQHYWRRHAEACEGQGSDRWVFPPPIYDEEGYRERVRDEEQGGVAGGSVSNLANRSDDTPGPARVEAVGLQGSGLRGGW